MFDLRRTKPLRVCYMIDRLCVGGTETQLIELLNTFDRRDVIPHLCLLDGNGDESRALEPPNCPVIRLGLRRLRDPVNFLKATMLYSFLKRHRIQVLHTYFKDSMYFGAPVARIAGVPIVVRSHRGYEASEEQRPGRWGSLLDRLYRSRLISATVTNSYSLADHLAGCPGHRHIEIIENGKHLQPFLDIDRQPFVALGERLPTITTLGMLRPVKRHDVLVDAAAMLVNVGQGARFRVGGEGPCRALLEDRIACLGLRDTFQLDGLVRDVPRFLAEADISVLTSDSEGLSNALIESMAAGRTIVATAVGGNPELIRDGVNGILIPPNDPAALARALVQLIANPLKAQSLAYRARTDVRGRFDHATVAARHSRLYASLLWRFQYDDCVS